MLWKLLCFVFVVAVVEAGDLKLPDEIKRCRKSDKGQNQCLVNAVQKFMEISAHGFPNVNMPAIDPLDGKDMVLNQFGIKANLSNIQIMGLSKIKVMSATINWRKRIGRIAFNFPTYKEIANFDVDGNILLFPVKASGEIGMIIKNMKCQINFKIGYSKNNHGYSSMELRKPVASCEILDGIYLDLRKIKNENDRSMAQTAIDLIHANWRIFANQFVPTFAEAVGSNVVSVFNVYLGQVSVDDLYEV